MKLNHKTTETRLKSMDRRYYRTITHIDVMYYCKYQTIRRHVWKQIFKTHIYHTSPYSDPGCLGELWVSRNESRRVYDWRAKILLNILGWCSYFLLYQEKNKCGGVSYNSNKVEDSRYDENHLCFHWVVVS